LGAFYLLYLLNNKKVTKMISAKGYCKCLYEIENNLTRTQHCFVPCTGQYELAKQREKYKGDAEKEV